MSSVTTAANSRDLPRRSGPEREPARLRVLEFVGVVPVVLFLGWQAASSWSALADHLPGLLAWLAVVAVADLMPVPVWGTAELTTSFPVLLAAAMVFPPPVAGLLGFVGPSDLREFRREISLMRGLFNRANIALSVMGASWVFRLLDGDVRDWPEALLIAFLALLVDIMINASFVTIGMHTLTGVSPRVVLANVYWGSQTLPFLVGYACFGLLAILLATVYLVAGTWGLVAFAIPLLLARQMFAHWKRLGETSQQLLEKQQALLSVSQRVADERREERLSVAAGIHDEVLPPLYKVHLMGQVLRQDLATGRLLDLEDDLPDLLRAADAANEAGRSLIRDLRESPLGAFGLAETLRLLVGNLQTLTSARFELDLEEVGGSALQQLLAYQVAREALTNAARHSGATEIRLALAVREGCIRLVVDDDGDGFQPLSVDRSLHFGLQLMRERVELLGGLLHVATEGGRGTTVVARIPIDTP